jgi:predicted XRE-type DNA-binding protein
MASAAPFLKTKLETVSNNVRNFAEIFGAYKECTPDIQKIVDEMIAIFCNADSTKDEKQCAVDVILESLFPGLMTDFVQINKKLVRLEPSKESLEKQEKVFADRLARLIRERKVTQTEVAKLIGVQQPAISMMLKRKCRPQKQTVLKLAVALAVEPDDLWPGINST